MPGTPVPTAPQAQTRVRAPPTTPMPRPKPRTPFGQKVQLQWMAQKRGLNEDAQAQACNNAQKKRAAPGCAGAPEQPAAGRPQQQGAAGAAGSPAQATPPPKRAHVATRPKFMYLPAGFEVGKEPIGDVRTTVDGNAGTRPLSDVLYPPGAKPGSRVDDSLTGSKMPDGTSCNKPSKTWTRSDQATAEYYAREHGYTMGSAEAAPVQHTRLRAP